ncbi:kinase-like domain-containing protein [Usnea florida]
MSTKKRRNSSDEAAKSDSKAQSALPPKKLRLSPTIEVAGKIRSAEAVPRRDGTYKPTSAPLQPIEPHSQQNFFSEGSRPKEHNKRVTSRDQSPNSLPYSLPPHWFDSEPELPHAVPLADGELSFWKTEHAAFIRSAAGLGNAKWIGVRPLGSGGFGTAGLWELRDEDNAVTKQMVIKESNAFHAQEWAREGVPEEVKMMRRMNKTDCPTVPDLIGYKRYVKVRKHRIYMEFCPHGDLEFLNIKYKRFWTFFPEPFLWYTFYNLVKVAVAMERGPHDSSWGYQIVHRDLKPGNIFLGLEDENSEFPTYPVAKIGDWGLACKIKPDDHENPIRLQGPGTPHYLAPEQLLPADVSERQTQINKHESGKAPLPKISAHTNIWGIGAIMFELWIHEPVTHFLVDMVLKDVPDTHNPRYSSTLTDLIKLCLMKEPEERPRLEELELKIGTKFQSISTEYVANPSLIEHERLYYKGSEINQMPPGEGNGNYWRPVLEVLTNPSAYSGPDYIKNPFTARIIYPPRPGSENDGPEVAEREAQKRNDDVESNKGLGNHDARKLKTGAGADNPIVLPSQDADGGVERERGAEAGNPIVLSSQDEDVGVEAERDDVSDRDGDGSNGSEDEEDGVEKERDDVSDRDCDGSNGSEDEEDGVEADRGDVSERDSDGSNGSEDEEDGVERERGAGADNPIILSSQEEDDEVERERSDVSDRDGAGSNDSEDRSSSEPKSDDSDDSSTRRRMAIKKPVLS